MPNGLAYPIIYVRGFAGGTTASPDLGGWLRQREHRSWTRIDMARRLIRAAQASGDTAMPAAEDVAASIYRWERGPISRSAPSAPAGLPGVKRHVMLGRNYL